MSATLQIDPWKNLAEPKAADPFASSPALSMETRELLRRARQLKNVETPSNLSPDLVNHAENVFAALANAKMATARVAMHLSNEWRQQLFRELDVLHDVDEWESGDKPVTEGSYTTFLRAILALHIGRRPGLGLSSDGNLVAAWTVGPDRLTLEFLPQNKVRWTVSRNVMGETERAAGIGSVKRLEDVLAPYNPAAWFTP
jgi:hypothetical protein